MTCIKKFVYLDNKWWILMPDEMFSCCDEDLCLEECDAM
jgi:hypothetical protein